jgi:hypothetical protein
MSDKTIRITKERLAYLEFLEKNISTIVNNAVFEIIDREKPVNRKEQKPLVLTNQVSTMSVNLSPRSDRVD